MPVVIFDVRHVARKLIGYTRDSKTILTQLTSVIYIIDLDTQIHKLPTFCIHCLFFSQMQLIKTRHSALKIHTVNCEPI